MDKALSESTPTLLEYSTAWLASLLLTFSYIIESKVDLEGPRTGPRILQLVDKAASETAFPFLVYSTLLLSGHHNNHSTHQS